MLSDIDVFRATTRHERSERLLYYFGCVDDLQRRLQAHVGEGRSIAAHYGCWESVHLGPTRGEGLPVPDFARYYADEPLPAGATIDGRGVASVPSGFYHFWGYVSPLRHAQSLRDIETYPWPEPGALRFDHYAGVAAEARRTGRVSSSWIGHIYENAWQVRGYEEFLFDLVERPAWAECLLERIAEQNRAQAVAAVRAGVDFLSCGDDVANQQALMFSHAMWRRFFKPVWEKVWSAARAIDPTVQIKYHSDGNILAVIPELIEMGVTILNPLQPECLDVDRVHREWGRDLVLDGCIGTQTTMPFGTPDDVRRRTREVIDRYGQNGALILAPTHALEPEVPIANIEAFVETCRDA